MNSENGEFVYEFWAITDPEYPQWSEAKRYCARRDRAFAAEAQLKMMNKGVAQIGHEDLMSKSSLPRGIVTGWIPKQAAWSKTWPAEPGFYWVRREDREPQPCEVDADGMVMFPGSDVWCFPDSDWAGELFFWPHRLTPPTALQPFEGATP